MGLLPFQENPDHATVETSRLFCVCESGMELLPFFLVIMDPFVSPHYERRSNGLRMIPRFFEKPEP